MGSEAQLFMFDLITKNMKEKLAPKPELFDMIIPKFAVGCRRFTPGQGYLEALVEENVTVRTDDIVEIVKEGLIMKNGTLVPVDAIICATGFDTSYRPGWPLIACGKNLRDEWKDEPRSYLSIAAEGFPNYFSK
jgi:cation diffusion facilitator CzcD-associated flavoprotein CzcO